MPPVWATPRHLFSANYSDWLGSDGRPGPGATLHMQTPIALTDARRATHSGESAARPSETALMKEVHSGGQLGANLEGKQNRVWSDACGQHQHHTRNIDSMTTGGARLDRAAGISLRDGQRH